MAIFRTLAIAAAAALAFTAGARAADVPGLWPADEEEKSPQFREYRSGWYLRGDIGYRSNRLGSVESVNPVVSSTYDKAVSAGFGFGFKDRWFRGDVTIDYGAPAKFHGTTQAVTTQPQYSAKIDSATGLLNGYVDLGTWSSITPYAGAGIGVSYLRVSDFRNSNAPATDLVSVQPKFNFAWAAMAGISFRVAPLWEIDVGYRYLNLGSALSGKEATGVQTSFRNLTAQEIRVGVRFQLD